jgi:hypothetical protein
MERNHKDCIRGYYRCSKAETKEMVNISISKEKAIELGLI